MPSRRAGVPPYARTASAEKLIRVTRAASCADRADRRCSPSSPWHDGAVTAVAGAPERRDDDARAPVAGFAWGSFAVGACVFAVLAAVASRYGYHRDELYFLEAGRHLSWGYPDQPPLVPLLARLLNDLAPGSVAVLRVPSAVAVAVVVPVTAAIARLLG